MNEEALDWSGEQRERALGKLHKLLKDEDKPIAPPGWVAHGDGGRVKLGSGETSVTEGELPGTQRMRQISVPMPEFGPPPPLRRLSPAEKKQNIAKRLFYQAANGGLGASIEEELRQNGWMGKREIVAEDIWNLAARCLARAERERDMADSKRIVRARPIGG